MRVECVASEIIVTGQIASTLGESLNTLLPILAQQSERGTEQVAILPSILMQGSLPPT